MTTAEDWVLLTVVHPIAADVVWQLGVKTLATRRIVLPNGCTSICTNCWLLLMTQIVLIPLIAKRTRTNHAVRQRETTRNTSFTKEAIPAHLVLSKPKRRMRMVNM